VRLFGKGDNISDNNDRPTFQIEPFTLRFKNEFPTLTQGASFQNFSESSAVDPSIRSEFEDGTVLSRARFTTLKKSFTIGYNFITSADKTKLTSMQTAIKIGANTFFWTNPSDDTEYEVYLMGPMQFQVEPRNFNYWSVMLNLAEV